MGEKTPAWKKYYEKNKAAHFKATAEYQKEHTKFIGLRFNIEYDHDILSRLDSVKSKVGYIKQLIRDDIKRTGFEVPESPAERAKRERDEALDAENARFRAAQEQDRAVPSSLSDADVQKLLGL